MTVYENDEIDLKPYIQALIRKWWLLAIFALIGIALGLMISRLPGEKYQSTAIILLTKQTTKFSLTSQLPTTSEVGDTRTRAETIISLAESDSVASQVMALLQDQLPAEITLEGFKKSVTFETVADTIRVTAVAKDPALAEAIANTWSLTMIESVNLAYSGEQPLSLVKSQPETAKVDYEAAQASLETFLAISQIEALQQNLDELNVLYNGQTNDRLALYEYYRTRKNEMLAIQIQGEALKAQMRQGNQSAAGDFGDALAVLLSRATVLSLSTNFQNNARNSNSPQPAQTTYQQEFFSVSHPNETALTFQINDLDTFRDTSQNYLADVEVIIELAKTEQAKAETALQELSQAILSDENTKTLDDAFTKIRQVKAQLENEQASYDQLKNARDLAWTAYQALSTKETEIKNAPKESNYVVLVSPAMAPIEPMPRGTLRNMLVGAAAGFFLSTIVILVRAWWLSANIFNDAKETSNAATPEKSA